MLKATIPWFVALSVFCLAIIDPIDLTNYNANDAYILGGMVVGFSSTLTLLIAALFEKIN